MNGFPKRYLVLPGDCSLLCSNVSLSFVVLILVRSSRSSSKSSRGSEISPWLKVTLALSWELGMADEALESFAKPHVVEFDTVDDCSTSNSLFELDDTSAVSKVSLGTDVVGMFSLHAVTSSCSLFWAGDVSISALLCPCFLFVTAVCNWGDSFSLAPTALFSSALSNVFLFLSLI